MVEKVTVMVLKVDLQCPCCYQKVKKIICKFPQIRDQEYNAKANTVTVTVVCCNPEKIRDKLCCKGAKVIKSIEIKEPQKPKDKKPKKVMIEDKTEEKTKEEVTKPPPPSCSEGYGGGPCDHGHGVPPPVQTLPLPTCKPSVEPCPIKSPPARTCCGPCSEGYSGGPCYHGYGVPPPAPTLPPPPCKPSVVPCPIRSSPERTCCGPCSEGYNGGPCYHGYGVPPPENEQAQIPSPSPRKPAVRSPPVKTCCGPCSKGYGGGPCYHGYEIPPPRQPCYDGCYGYDYSYGYGKPYHITRCDYYFSEENPGACAII